GEGDLKELLKKIQYLEGTRYILIIENIDEILRDHVDIFVQFREALGRKGITIIGTTIDKNVVESLRSQEGMVRRIRVIDVPTMTPAEAQATVSLEMSALQQNYSSRDRFSFEFEGELPSAIVELSVILYPERTLPERAVVFLREMCIYFKNETTARCQKTLRITDVIQYVSFLTKTPTHLLEAKLLRIENKIAFKANFDARFFPPLDPQDTKVPWITAEAENLWWMLSRYPLLILQGDSQASLKAIVSQSQNSEEPPAIYRCDVMKLMKEADTMGGRECLSECCHRLFGNREKKAILVLENCPSSWFSPEILQEPMRPALPPPPTEIQDTVDYGIRMAKMLGIPGVEGIGNVVQSVVAQQTPAPQKPVDEKMPAIIKELFKLIEGDPHACCLALVTAENRLSFEKKGWHSLQTLKIPLRQALLWLEEKYHAKKELSPSDEGKPPIRKIVQTLYYLQDPRITCTILDLAVQIVDLIAGINISHLDGIFTHVLESSNRGPRITRERVKEALEWSEKRHQNAPFMPIQPSIKEITPSLRKALRHLTASATPAILWLTEESQMGKKWFCNQMAFSLQNEEKNCVCFNSDYTEEITNAFEDMEMEEHLAALNEQIVIIMDDKELKNPIIRKMVERKRVKIICFKSSKPLDTATPVSQIDDLFNTGVQLVQTHLPQVLSSFNPQKPPSVNALSTYTQFTYNPGANERSSLVSLLNRYVKEMGGTPELSRIIERLYPLLGKNGQKTDHICALLNNDFGLLKEIPLDKVGGQFHELYGSELHMSLQDIHYEINSAGASFFYRVRRAAKQGFQYVISLASFRWSPWALSTATSLIGSSIMGNIFGILRRLVFR
ncbi:MAG TPA: hypothetical protein VMR37_01170, partial [Rhabdochlamydiaceae bacterium]|nr:hypothetical protein [Rhabdochlamydiaceae bacterium]